MREHDANAEAGTVNTRSERAAMFDIDDVGVFLGLDVGKSAHHGHGLTPAGQEGLRQAAAQQRAETAGRLRQAGGEVRHRPGDRGPARLHRRPAPDRRPGRGLQGRLPARTGDAADRRPLPRRGEDRRQGRGRDRGRRPHHAAHPALAGTDRRDHRRADRAGRLRPGPRRPRPPAPPTGYAACSPSSTPAWNASSARAWTTRPSPGCWSATDPRPPCARPAAAGSSS